MNNTEQPGQLRLERTAVGASVRAEHSTAVRTLCISVCVVNSQCAGRWCLTGPPAASRVPKVSLAQYVQLSF